MAMTLAVDIDGTITENGNGMIHLGALGALRSLAASGHRVIYVTGRSSVEAFVLSVFGGTGRGAGGVSVGENGGCITLGPADHIKLGDIAECRRAYEIFRQSIPAIREKAVFPRMTEVVLERTFDLDEARRITSKEGLDVSLADSGYAFHINSSGIDKGYGLGEVMARYDIPKDKVIAIGDSQTDIPMFRMAGTSVALGNASEEVRAAASIRTEAPGGDGVIEALQVLGPRMVNR